MTEDVLDEREVSVREADPDDLPVVMSVIDAGLLAIDAGTVRERIAQGEVLVYAEGGRVLGALVLDGTHVDAIAVRRSRRDQDIGTELVEAALSRHGRLTADFREEIRAFYESLGFEIEGGDGLLWGVLTEES